MTKYTFGPGLTFWHLCCQGYSCYLRKLLPRFRSGRHVVVKNRLAKNFPIAEKKHTRIVKYYKEPAGQIERQTTVLLHSAPQIKRQHMSVLVLIMTEKL